MNRKIFSLCSLLLSLPLVMQAHDGHGLFSGRHLEHYISSPGHAIPVLLVTVVFLVLIFYRKRIRIRG